MLNKIKVKNFELWDAETGEADITASFANNLEIKAFTLDHFEVGDSEEVIVSLFCHEFKISEEEIKPMIENVDDEFHAKVAGKILDFKSDEEEGNVLMIDANGIFVSVYLASEDNEISATNGYFSGYGRLDIETEIIS